VGSTLLNLICSKDHEFSLSSLDYQGCDSFASNEIMELVKMCRDHIHMLDYVYFEDQGLDSDKIDLIEHLSPNIVKAKPFANNKHYLYDFCRFAQVLQYLPSLNSVEINF